MIKLSAQLAMQQRRRSLFFLFRRLFIYLFTSKKEEKTAAYICIFVYLYICIFTSLRPFPYPSLTRADFISRACRRAAAAEGPDSRSRPTSCAEVLAPQRRLRPQTPPALCWPQHQTGKTIRLPQVNRDRPSVGAWVGAVVVHPPLQPKCQHRRHLHRGGFRRRPPAARARFAASWLLISSTRRPVTRLVSANRCRSRKNLTALQCL